MNKAKLLKEYRKKARTEETEIENWLKSLIRKDQEAIIEYELDINWDSNGVGNKAKIVWLFGDIFDHSVIESVYNRIEKAWEKWAESGE